jgi:hypothetical protein
MPRLFLFPWARDDEFGVQVIGVPEGAIEVTPKTVRKLRDALASGDLSGLATDDMAKVEAMPDRARAMLAAHLEDR